MPRETSPAEAELKQTASQTVGPFFHPGLIRETRNVLAGEGVKGERITIVGRVQDGDGAGVPDAMVEIWQADAAGEFHEQVEGFRERAEGFCSFGRAATGSGGEFRFETVKPGAVPTASGETQAPHVNVHVFARGLLIHAFTRLYFEDESANSSDPVLSSVPEERRSTLLARRTGDQPATYRFDIHLQGEGETVFFDP